MIKYCVLTLMLIIFLAETTYAQTAAPSFGVCKAINGHTYPHCSSASAECGTNETSYYGKTFEGDCSQKEPRFFCRNTGGPYYVEYRDRNLFYLKDNSDIIIYESPIYETGYVSKIFGGTGLSGQASTFWLRCHDDIQFGNKYVSIRHGRLLDLFHFVAVVDNKPIELSTRLQDGQHHGVIHTDRGPLIKLGRKKDVFIQYCFDGRKWTSSDVMRNGENLNYPCGDDAIVMYNVSDIDHDPARQKPPKSVGNKHKQTGTFSTCPLGERNSNGACK